MGTLLKADGDIPIADHHHGGGIDKVAEDVTGFGRLVGDELEDFVCLLSDRTRTTYSTYPVILPIWHVECFRFNIKPKWSQQRATPYGSACCEDLGE